MARKHKDLRESKKKKPFILWQLISAIIGFAQLLVGIISLLK